MSSLFFRVGRGWVQRKRSGVGRVSGEDIFLLSRCVPEQAAGAGPAVAAAAVVLVEQEVVGLVVLVVLVHCGVVDAGAGADAPAEVAVAAVAGREGPVGVDRHVGVLVADAAAALQLVVVGRRGRGVAWVSVASVILFAHLAVMLHQVIVILAQIAVENVYRVRAYLTVM